MTDALYSVEALSTGGGRDGHVRTADGALDTGMSAPKELGGAGNGMNPEQFFAAGYAACFHSALLGSARRLKKTVDGSSVGARVSLLPTDDGLVQLAVHLEVVIPELPHDEAEELAAMAHEGCPYSRATRGNIEVTISVSDD